MPRDLLWAAFKDLEANFAKFSAKSTTAQKMVVVRGNLVPFLRRYASDKDAKLLAPQDVERRAVITRQVVERPAGSAGRPGHRQVEAGRGHADCRRPPAANRRYRPPDAAGSHHHVSWCVPSGESSRRSSGPWSTAPPQERVRARSNTADSAAFGEAAAAFLDESAEHNVRTMFVANLLAQMSLVVDKMSLRHAPLSLVNFGGKACAYAFFFVPRRRRRARQAMGPRPQAGPPQAHCRRRRPAETQHGRERRHRRSLPPEPGPPGLVVGQRHGPEAEPGAEAGLPGCQYPVARPVGVALAGRRDGPVLHFLQVFLHPRRRVHALAAAARREGPARPPSCCCSRSCCRSSTTPSTASRPSTP